MNQSIGYVTLMVRDYDEASDFYVNVLGFRLVEDTVIAAQNKRWVLVAPPGSTETNLLLARAVGPEESTIMNIRIRSEISADILAIEAVTEAAFRDAAHTSHTEHFIVNALRDAGQLSVSLLAEEAGEVVGHIAISPVSISDGSKQWYGLGPVSVSPQRQRQGIGSQLMERALDDLRQLGASGCVVLGYPDFYGRFGFNVVPQLILPDVPPEYFKAICFGVEAPAGTVSYHAAFDATS